MIDERINQTLSELETNLKNVESARLQVEKTANSYDGLKSATAEYVKLLGNITEKSQELINNVGNDYTQKVVLFDKDRETIINTTNDAIEKFSKTTGVIQSRLKYILIINLISLVAIAGILAMIFIKLL